MPAGRPKKNDTPAFDFNKQFADIAKQQKARDDLSKGGVYAIEPVDLITFVSHPDYLNTELFEGCDVYLSPAQEEFITKASTFENNINTMVAWVGKGKMSSSANLFA